MNSFHYASIVLIVLMFLTFVFIIIKNLIYTKAKQYVIENSITLKRLSGLSSRFHFHSLKSPYIYRKSQKSLSSFRKINYDKELLSYLESRQIFFREQMEKADENEKNYKKYYSEFNYICNTVKTEWNSKLKARIEATMITKNKLSPVCSISIKIENTYVSPKGRNRYYDSHTFPQSDIMRAFSVLQRQNDFKAKKQKERAKMSDSLRYDILKRDGFRCTICGATAQDGESLHVDHILPIAKGGKTIENNLRTLCSSCNLGKADKYDPDGIN